MDEVRAVPTLVGANVTLRPPVASDRDGRMALGRHAEIVRGFGGDTATPPEPMTEAQADAWFAQLAGDRWSWVIEHGGAFLGTIRLFDMDERDLRARLAIGLFDPAQLGRGLGRETIRLVAAFAFETLGLHRLTLRVVAYNERAIRCYQACGFQVEGREREAALVDEQRHDDVIMGLLRSDWLAGQ